MSVRILTGDVRAMLKTLPDESVNCCVTSPPYWGLRDYGTAKWEGGEAGCDHKQEAPRFNGPKQTSAQVSGHASKAESHGRRQCQKCGATSTDSQLGLESTPAEYVEKMVAVFSEVKRVLRDDATLWLNLGDSYFGGGRGGNPDESPYRKQATNAGSLVAPTKIPAGMKAKDLCGIPWRVAFALQADGWYLRQDIIWAKPNPMPESVTDRCTKSHEYLFLLAKSERYYCDMAAIKEPAVYAAGEGGHQSFGKAGGKAEISYGSMVSGEKWDSDGTRNKRSVWTVATQPYAEAHFATFPPKLIEPCILAGTKPGGVVLDPFGGAGTTGLVADRHGRDAILCELNPEYAAMAHRRIFNDSPLFAELA